MNKNILFVSIVIVIITVGIFLQLHFNEQSVKTKAVCINLGYETGKTDFYGNQCLNKTCVQTSAGSVCRSNWFDIGDIE